MSAESVSSSTAHAAERPVLTGRRWRIVILDDEQSIKSLLKLILEGEGYEGTKSQACDFGKAAACASARRKRLAPPRIPGEAEQGGEGMRNRSVHHLAVIVAGSAMLVALLAAPPSAAARTASAKPGASASTCSLSAEFQPAGLHHSDTQSFSLRTYPLFKALALADIEPG